MALTLTESDLADAIGDADAAKRLLPVVTELVNEYAPDAPDALANEAAIRAAAWLRDAPADGARRSVAGPVSVTYNTGNQNALRHSGAASLLTRWKKRRAGAI